MCFPSQFTLLSSYVATIWGFWHMQVVLDDISTNQQVTKKTWWAYMLSWNFLSFLSFSVPSSLLPSLTTPPCSAAPKHRGGIWPRHCSPGRLLTHMDSRKGMFALNVWLLNAWNQQSQALVWALICMAYADMIFPSVTEWTFQLFSFWKKVGYTKVQIGREQV